MTIQDTQGSTANLGGVNAGAFTNLNPIGIEQLVRNYTELYGTAVTIFSDRAHGFQQTEIMEKAEGLMAILWPCYVASLQRVFGFNLGSLTLGQNNANVSNVAQRGAA